VGMIYSSLALNWRALLHLTHKFLLTRLRRVDTPGMTRTQENITPIFTYKKRTVKKKRRQLNGAVSLFCRIFFLILYEKMSWNESYRRGVASFGWGCSGRASFEGLSVWYQDVAVQLCEWAQSCLCVLITRYSLNVSHRTLVLISR
jgi:hypothetical protein